MAEKTRADGHATGMAGEFFVMERLFRLGVLPALTVGNAKTVDILVRSLTGKNLAVSVKAVRNTSGKWSVGSEDYSDQSDLIFVFLLYDDFGNLETSPRAWVIPAVDVEQIKLPWMSKGGYAVYHGSRIQTQSLEQYENAWERYFS